MSRQLSLDDLGGPRGLTRAELMTAREVAELIGVPVSTILESGRNGTLPRVKLGRHVRFIRAHVEAAISRRSSETTQLALQIGPLSWSAGGLSRARTPSVNEKSPALCRAFLRSG
jgi:excisionase family DNA binding protein